MVSTEHGSTVVYGFGLWLSSQVMDLWAEFDLQWGGCGFRWSGGF